MVRILCVATLLCAVAMAAAQPARAQGDAAQGKKVFRKCAVCHDTRPGKTKIGPSLFGVIGRKSGTLPGYRFSSAMRKSNIMWSKDTLERYLENPRKVVPRHAHGVRGPALQAGPRRRDRLSRDSQVSLPP